MSSDNLTYLGEQIGIPTDGKDLFGAPYVKDVNDLFVQWLWRPLVSVGIKPARAKEIVSSAAIGSTPGSILALALTPAGWTYCVCEWSEFDPTDHPRMMTWHIGLFAGLLDPARVGHWTEAKQREERAALRG